MWSRTGFRRAALSLVGLLSVMFLAPALSMGGDACDCSYHGDLNGDATVNLLDLTTLIDHAFLSGAPLTTDATCPHLNRGDFNCDWRINMVDVVKMVDYLFRGGDGPCHPCRPGLGPAGLLYVPNQTDGTIYVYDTETLVRVDSFPAQIVSPHFVVFSPVDDYYYVISRATNGIISKFDATDNSLVLSGSHVGLFPTAMAITPDGMFGYVADFSAPGEITKFYKFNLNTMMVVDSLQAGAMSHDIETSPNGDLIIGTNMGDLITFIYVDADTVYQVPIDPDSMYAPARRKYGPYGIQFHPNGQKAYVACLHSVEVEPQVRVIDVGQRKVVDSVIVPIAPTPNAPAAPCQLDISPDGSVLYVTNQWGNSVIAIRTSDLIVIADIPLEKPKTFGIDITSDGSRVYAAAVGIQNEFGRIYIIDGNTQTKIDSIDVGRNPFGLGWRPPVVK